MARTAAAKDGPASPPPLQRVRIDDVIKYVRSAKDSAHPDIKAARLSLHSFFVARGGMWLDFLELNANCADCFTILRKYYMDSSKWEDELKTPPPAPEPEAA